MHDTASTSSRLSSLSPSNQNPNGSPSPMGRVGNIGNAEMLEEFYSQWKLDPSSVDPVWASFFEGFELGCQLQPDTTSPASPQQTSSPAPRIPVDDEYRLKQARVYNMLFAYRTLGHMKANLDPLGLTTPTIKDLELSNFKFTDQDLNLNFNSGTLATGGERTLGEIYTILNETYCANIGVEYMHIQNFTHRRWLRDRMETSRNKPSFSREKKMRILRRLQSAELFEKFLHTRYVGQKRFSLEGGETLIPMLDALVESCPSLGIQQVVMGMPHRGRLNVLVNILGKSYRMVFNEFAENHIPEAVQGDGDVKYHLGYESLVSTSTGEKVNISLAPNPSHLEAVNPVVEGKTRARQRFLNDTIERSSVVPVLLHGDAAFIGQGIVAETLNLSQLEGYRTGGTLHIVVNNQIGFTTVPKDARSTIYCTALAKTLGSPIFHVNGDDPLSAVHILELALEYRQRFKRDIVIDLVCYRRHGHNEGDEPNFTQPTLYSAIDSHGHVSDKLLEILKASGDLSEAEAHSYRDKFFEQLNSELALSKAAAAKFSPKIRKPLSTPELLRPVCTTVAEVTLREVGHSITEAPKGFKVNKKIQRLLQSRRDMVDDKAPIDWGCAEALCFGSLLVQGIPIRLSGQDSRRGTFSHRHCALYDSATRERHIPLKNITPDQASFCVYNSPLSEAAVLGFDFGYSLDCPSMLIIWEAQFGDFANGAQTIIDQYITTSESKWGVTSRIVLLLPHGYHGQGPEHSSARLERFLQACAEDNIQVGNCTTPAQYFHIMRRQALRDIRKPLVLMTPKGLLRDKHAVSSLEELSNGSFHEIIADPHSEPDKVKRVILCSGKLYYELEEYQKENERIDAVIIRVEQLYPLHEEKLREAILAFPKAEKLIWAQEESQNMGAWSFIEPRIRTLFGRNVHYAGRDASSSPATGSLAIHSLEQKDVLDQAFNG